MFDIIAPDAPIKKQEKTKDMKMTYNNQCKVPRVGYASNVDSKWRRSFF